MKFTVTRIDGLKCPDGKRDMLVFDDEQRGLAVRVTASGGKSYLAQYSFHGTKRRMSLGSCGAVSLAKAREAARALMGEVAKGHDPAAERKAAAADARRKEAHQALTLSVLIENWEALHLANKRPRYRSEAVQVVRAAFAGYLDLPAADIDRAAIVKAVDAIARKGKPYAATLAIMYGKAAFGWAYRRGALTANPFSHIPVTPIARRERVLSDYEIAGIWRATDKGFAIHRITRLLILTGQRLNEVAGMTWDELSDDLSTWTIPSSRTKRS